MRDIRKSSDYAFVAGNQETIRSLLSGDKPPDVGAIDTFVKNANQYPTVMMLAKTVRRLKLDTSTGGVAARTKLVDLYLPADASAETYSSDKSLNGRLADARILAITGAKLLVDRLNDLILVGDFQSSGSAVVFLFAILLAAYIAFHILSVFYTSQLLVVYRHPQYSILCLQLAIIVLAPIFLLNLVEATYWQEYSDLVKGAFGSLQLDGRDFLRIRSGNISLMLGESIGSPSAAGASPINVSRFTSIALLIPIASIIAITIWLTRRFGWGVFLTAILICGVVFLLLTGLAGSGNLVASYADIPLLAGFYMIGTRVDGVTHTVFLGALAIFSLVLILGKVFVPFRFKRYPFCVGYSGNLFSLTFMTAFCLGVPIKPGIGAAIVCIVITICAVSLLEFVMRKLFYGFLYEPQP